MQSLSAHVAFYELMPLQECFEETTIFVCFVGGGFFLLFFKLPPFSLQSNKRSSDLTPSSPPEPYDHVSRRRAESGHLVVAFAVQSSVAFVIST